MMLDCSGENEILTSFFFFGRSARTCIENAFHASFFFGPRHLNGKRNLMCTRRLSSPLSVTVLTFKPNENINMSTVKKHKLVEKVIILKHFSPAVHSIEAVNGHLCCDAGFTLRHI